MFSKLQYISQGKTPEEQLYNIQSALDAGCTWIQLRVKNQEEAIVHQLAAQTKKSCEAYEAILIINDFVQVAQAVGADGVHVGLADMTVSEARTIVGSKKIVGGTANTLEDVLQRIKEQCDYIGLGPFRFTTTKEKLSPILGVAGYQQIMDILDAASFSIPVYAIGGITADDVALIRSTGVYGVALSGVITQAPDQKALVQQLNHKLYATPVHSR
jgi:thiamine-phosphate pyrophosphorylase